jgi:hypothetical protein
MKYFISIILLLSLFLSCAGYRKTIFTLNSVRLGDSIDSVTKRYGNPFKSDVYSQNDIHLTKIYYKEAVDVSSYTYMLTTVLTFKDSILINIGQKENYLPDGKNIISVEPINDNIP